MPIPLTVTGVEATGQMFRERTLVLGLDGRECQYQSKHEVCVDSIVLLALDSTGGGQDSPPVRGRVKSLQPLQTTRNLFRISVELETSQTIRVVPSGQEHPLEKRDAPAPAGDELRDLTARIVSLSSEIVKSAVANEMSQHLGTLKDSLSHEMNESVQAAVASAIEPIIHDAVEQQTTQLYQAVTQALHTDVTHQLAKQLAEGDQLRTCLAGLKQMVAEGLSELWQAAATRAGEELHVRATAIQQAYDQAIAQMRDHIGNARANLGDVLTRAQAADREIRDVMTRVRESSEQIRNAEAIVADKLDEHFRSRLDAFDAELSKRLDQVIEGSAARWVRSVQQQMDPYMKHVDERLEILAGGLQLAQIQHDQVAELSRTAAANFEKDLRAVFLRYSANT
jgi:hypothetical protein